MSKSNPKLKLTKAGIALSAEARSRLQQLAKWIEQETQRNQDPRVRLEYCGGILSSTNHNVTSVSPIGALVQMFDPFVLADAKPLIFGLYCVDSTQLATRAANILGLTPHDYLQFIRYLYSSNPLTFADVAKTLRTLK